MFIKEQCIEYFAMSSEFQAAEDAHMENLPACFDAAWYTDLVALFFMV